MLQATELKKLSFNFETIKKRGGGEYINTAAGFDIETTSEIHQNNKVAYSYVWGLRLDNDSPLYYGRTLSEFYEVCLFISRKLKLSESKVLVIYIHNLSYEFQFIRKYFEWVNVFSLDERKPIKALTSLGIEFRCSYILSGMNLATLAKNLTKHKIKKLEGDLDYSLTRHHNTPLTEKEFEYLKNDVEIITNYITEQMEIYGNILNIPLTNTGRVRMYVKDECYKNNGKRDKAKYCKYRQTMSDLTLTPEIYTMLKRAFMGGFTHANKNYSGLTLEDVSSIDFTSSYPSVMVAEKYPMTRFKKAQPKTTKDFDKLLSKHAVVFNIKFTNLKSKIEQENYLSEHKSRTVNATVNNGRIYSADELTTTITEIDFEIIKQCYTWDDYQISNVHYAVKNYLPKAIIESVLKLYQGKTELKDVEGYEVEYLLSKGMLNSIYGMCVTDVVKDESLYTGEWSTEEADIDESITDYNESKNRFLYYPWGVWVTAYARRNLWSGILATGNDYIYSDTDSLKIFNIEKHQNYIEWFDKNIMAKMLKTCDHYKLDKKLITPKTKEGKIKPLGIWDFEGTFKLFKTLGAKRYLTLSNKLELTVAGLSKKKGVENLLKLSGNNPEKTFDYFTANWTVPANETGKMTHTYIDEDLKFITTDYLGNKEIIDVKSGIHLENCEFTLSISEQYENFLKQFSKGEFFKGVNKKWNTIHLTK